MVLNTTVLLDLDVWVQYYSIAPCQCPPVIPGWSVQVEQGWPKSGKVSLIGDWTTTTFNGNHICQRWDKHDFQKGPLIKASRRNPFTFDRTCRIWFYYWKSTVAERKRKIYLFHKSCAQVHDFFQNSNWICFNDESWKEVTLSPGLEMADRSMKWVPITFSQSGEAQASDSYSSYKCAHTCFGL